MHFHELGEETGWKSLGEECEASPELPFQLGRFRCFRALGQGGLRVL